MLPSHLSTYHHQTTVNLAMKNSSMKGERNIISPFHLQRWQLVFKKLALSFFFIPRTSPLAVHSLGSFCSSLGLALPPFPLLLNPLISSLFPINIPSTTNDCVLLVATHYNMLYGGILIMYTWTIHEYIFYKSSGNENSLYVKRAFWRTWNGPTTDFHTRTKKKTFYGLIYRWIASLKTRRLWSRYIYNPYSLIYNLFPPRKFKHLLRPPKKKWVYSPPFFEQEYNQ